MGGRSVFITILILVIVTNIAFAQEGLTPEQRGYFDNQNQKVVAQLSAKIDQSTNHATANMKSEVNTAKEQIKKELISTINSSLMGIVIGLSGIIIITLSVFKVIDYKLQANRNIVKYEAELKTHIDESKRLVDEQKKKVATLHDYRKSLLAYHQQLMAMSQGYMPNPMMSGSNVQIPVFDVPVPQKKQGLFSKIFKKKR